MTEASWDARAGRLRRHPYFAAAALAAAAAFTGVAVLSRLRLSDTASHAASHGVGIVAAGLFLALVLTMWPRPRADLTSRGVRHTLLLGIAIFLAGQILEAAGAFGYDGYRRVGRLARLHDVGVILGPAGLLLALAGFGLTVLLVFAGRMNILGSRWITYGFIAIILAVIAFLVGGFIFGY